MAPLAPARPPHSRGGCTTRVFMGGVAGLDSPAVVLGEPDSPADDP